MDELNKSLNSLGDGIKDISTQYGFKSYFNNLSSFNLNLSYDKQNKDIYIHDESYCFNFSELLQSFESFYSYNDVDAMHNA